RGAARVLQDLLGGFNNRRLTVLCGKGNNGGDGFVIAGIAAAAGATVQTFLFAASNQVQGDARFYLDRARANGLQIEEILESEPLPQVASALESSHAIVDALLGTGIRGGARGLVAEAIQLLKNARCPILAVDIPSGLDANTGEIKGPCAPATRTVTFGLPKRGLFFYPGRSLCGQVHLVDIGLPFSAVNAETDNTWLLAAGDASSLFPTRQPDAHKGDCGRVVVLAGSVGLTGAATLCARSALRSGAGLVTVGVPESLNDILEVNLTEAMTCPLPEVRKARCLALRARGNIQRLLENADCVAIGPGLGTHRETTELVKRLLSDIQIPAVLDADALNALAGEPQHLKKLVAPAVITPHPGEFSRLTGIGIKEIRANPLDLARELASATGVTVVLKGAPTVLATPDGAGFINPSGNAGLASGGSGDVLTGIIAALIGQGLNTAQAACLGVYLHGFAADCAVRSQAGLIASDIVDTLPEAEQKIRACQDQDHYLIAHKRLAQEQHLCPTSETA
ncbi:MAG: NAD(P)H-hydrate dehydratase, partial [bacterium]|nr:NAD(P)H-hydrate dehydratase [bacterium]